MKKQNTIKQEYILLRLNYIFIPGVTDGIIIIWFIIHWKINILHIINDIKYTVQAQWNVTHEDLAKLLINTMIGNFKPNVD